MNTKQKIVLTRDGVKVERKSNSNKGHIFFDEQGNGYKCLGYNEKLDDCVFMDLKNNIEVVGCVKGFYYNKPQQRKEINPVPSIAINAIMNK